MTEVTTRDRAAPAALPTSPLLERIRRGIIGEGELMDGPFGRGVRDNVPMAGLQRARDIVAAEVPAGVRPGNAGLQIPWGVYWRGPGRRLVRAGGRIPPGGDGPGRERGGG